MESSHPGIIAQSILKSILAIWLWLTLANPLFAQTGQLSAVDLDDKFAALDVIETAVLDLEFLLSVKDKKVADTDLVKQLKEDYFPLFDHDAIVRYVLKKRLTPMEREARDNFECLIGLTFFNFHLDLISPHFENQKLFVISDQVVGKSRSIFVEVLMNQGENFTPLTFHLRKRGDDRIWKIANIRIESSNLLSLLRRDAINVHRSAITNHEDPSQRTIEYLIKHNNDKYVRAEQWCDLLPLSDIEPQPVNQIPETQENTLVKAETRFNGQTQEVHVEVTPDGSVLYQEDIILGSDDDWDSALGVLNFRKLQLWTDAVVPYVIDESVPDKALVVKAVNEWSKRTPVQFVNASGEDKNVLQFTEGERCASSLGMIGGRQFITLHTKCTYGTVLHEIGHALGLIHEHSRFDRDEYITVKPMNVVHGKEFNFYKHPSGHPDLSSYCYGSIMHYSEHAFSKRQDLKTIVTKGGRSIGQRERLSSCDFDRIRTMYAPLVKVSEYDADSETESQKE